MMQLAAHAMTTANGDRERMCCNCWHIKHGTVVLGLLELVGVLLLLSGIVNKIVWKNNLTECRQTQSYFSRLFGDCLLRNFSHFDWTLAGDYVLALLLTLVFFCVLLLFVGIMKKSPTMLLPHLIVQGICLTFSLVYFFLYAWSYFYGDLYVQKNQFRLQSMLERMWLASLLLILAAFQLYLFFTVIKCCLYVQALKNMRLRRLHQFEECSKRVRDAKQNGLWRSTSWGGGFQQYKGQYDEGNQWKKKRDKPTTHVQWNLQANQEKSFSNTDGSLQEHAMITKQKPLSPSLQTNAITVMHPAVISPKISSSATISVTQLSSTCGIKKEQGEAKGKDGIANVAMDMQILEHVRSGPVRQKKFDSPKPQKLKVGRNETSSNDSIGAGTRRTGQDAKESREQSSSSEEQPAYRKCSAPVPSIAEKASDRQHHKHHHHHRHCKQDTVNFAGRSSPTKQLSVASEPAVSLKRSSAFPSGSHTSYLRNIP
ncbi:hypothetical protein Tcan_16751 [Toxocara canis]|uniref:Uncharacterized protein n=1 Tax=Toxocara canis TaxID=6265 RepID=A0A0B2VWB7_TOXCA|nr:hypothetical protein Tcan_16751 [Toxocara canis]